MLNILYIRLTQTAHKFGSISPVFAYFIVFYSSACVRRRDAVSGSFNLHYNLKTAVPFAVMVPSLRATTLALARTPAHLKRREFGPRLLARLTAVLAHGSGALHLHTRRHTRLRASVVVRHGSRQRVAALGLLDRLKRLRLFEFVEYTHRRDHLRVIVADALLFELGNPLLFLLNGEFE